MSAVDLMLELAGVPNELVAEVEKSAPNAAALLKLIKDNQALLDEIRTTATKTAPLITQAIPLINQAAAEIKSLMPVAQDIVAFIQKQKQSAATPSDLATASDAVT